MSSDPILFEATDGIATVTLNRPAALNALTARMHEDLAAALARAAADDAVRCLFLTGAGRGFCAGQDLTERAVSGDEAPVDLGDSLDKRYNPVVRAIVGMDKPVVCAVNGIAAGAGANLALACDIVLAARGAAFVQSFSRLGLVPDSGGTWLLPRLAGRGRAAALAMLGDAVPAEQAAAWGMIWRAVEDAALMEEAGAVAHRLAALPAAGLARIKRALRASWHNSLDAQLDLERDLQSLAGRDPAYRDGVAAFLAKRGSRA